MVLGSGDYCQLLVLVGGLVEIFSLLLGVLPDALDSRFDL
jgi:hypothetical protein